MKRRPPDEKGVGSAGTPSTPDEVQTVAGNKNSKRIYQLSGSGQDREELASKAQRKKAPPEADADARGSGHRAASEGFIPEHEREYLRIVAERSGEVIDEETFQRKKAEREKLIAQSVSIADKLESVGVRAYGESKLTLVGLISGIEEPLIDFRNIVFIPAVAKRKRVAMLADLEYFIQRHPFSRMWVMTSGTRVTIPEVRQRMQLTHRKISKLNYCAFMKQNGANIVFRSSELGSMKYVDGEPTFHIHCHLIVHLQKKLKSDQWSKLLRRVRNWWKFHFKDAKKIQMAREACKYVVKPNDLDKLNPCQLKALYEQLFKMHIVQALGSLKIQRKENEEKETKLIREKVGLDWKIRPIKNWNKSKRKKAPDEGYSDPPSDSIVATMLPAPYFSKKAEPVAIVLNRHRSDLRTKPRLKRISDMLNV